MGPTSSPVLAFTLTASIVIPKRPFIQQAFRNKDLHKQVQRNWQQALSAAMKEQAGT